MVSWQVIANYITTDFQVMVTMLHTYRGFTNKEVVGFIEEKIKV
jgi:hypothetical protein